MERVTPKPQLMMERDGTAYMCYAVMNDAKRDNSAMGIFSYRAR